MVATVCSATVFGVGGNAVNVEVHSGQGAPGFSIVGLPDATSREGRDRVRAAILSNGYTWTQTRTTVNLAPSHIPKIGSGLDVAIALAYLHDQGKLNDVSGLGAIGELGLDGSIRTIPGVLAMAGVLTCETLVVPMGNYYEAKSMTNARVVCASSLRDLVESLNGTRSFTIPSAPVEPCSPEPLPDFEDLRGQPVGRFAMEVAAAGGHNTLMIGPPGGGKTMLAQRIRSILPPLDNDESREVSRIYSAAGHRVGVRTLMEQPPFRAPHHSISTVALVGGGSSRLMPGEISLAHRGVLFLDELGEFGPATLDVLRQPIESGEITIARAHHRATLPAGFQLLAAMNPCPCGVGVDRGCQCSSAALQRYQRRLSGPLVDRFDIRVPIDAVDSRQLFDARPQESSNSIRERVNNARSIALTRGVRCNAQLSLVDLERFSMLSPPAKSMLLDCVAAGSLTARGLKRVWATATTIADLVEPSGHGVVNVSVESAQTALSLRSPISVTESSMNARPSYS